MVERASNVAYKVLKKSSNIKCGKLLFTYASYFSILLRCLGLSIAVGERKRKRKKRSARGDAGKSRKEMNVNLQKEKIKLRMKGVLKSYYRGDGDWMVIKMNVTVEQQNTHNWPLSSQTRLIISYSLCFWTWTLWGSSKTVAQHFYINVGQGWLTASIYFNM